MSEKFTPGPWVNIGNCRIHGTPAYMGLDATRPGGEWEGVPANSVQEVCVAFPASLYAYVLGGKEYPVREDVQERWWERNRANISLICAAPDLLEALKKAQNTLEGLGYGSIAKNICEQAIRKAEGND